MKLVKTRLRSRLSEDTLDQTMRICIEGPENLSDGELDMILDHWKQQKHCMNLYLCFIMSLDVITRARKRAG